MSSTPASSSSPPQYGSLPEQQDRRGRLLSARQIEMVAIGGVIGTGLFLGGHSLASILEPDDLDMDMEREDGEGNSSKPVLRVQHQYQIPAQVQAGAINPVGDERSTVGPLPLMREEDCVPPPPPTGSTKNKSNRRKKKSKKGKKKNPVPVPIVGLPSQQAEEHYPSTATPTEEPFTSPQPQERSRDPPNKGKRMRYVGATDGVDCYRRVGG